MNFDQLLSKVVELKASDLFITSDKPPSVKINGAVTSLDTKVLTSEQAKAMVLSLMDEKQQKEFHPKPWF